jgi:hypothetical protein
VNILIYADDIVLLSQSKEGLQNSLNILHDFCYIWKLKVNTDKSKIMIFNSNGKTYLSQFTYNNVDFETVANYCYLGMVLKFNGNFNLAIHTLENNILLFKGGSVKVSSTSIIRCFTMNS